MGNMSYCRFQNTAMDLDDCLEAMHNEEISELSESEGQAFVNLVMMAKEIAKMYEDYDEYKLIELVNNANQDEL